MRFKALKDFESKELKSHYVAGLSYTVRPGNDLLASLVPKWIEDKKIAPLESPQVQVEVKATGKVK